ncbi:MAG: hypothetical protein MK175_19240, partial [Pseudoalteromonas sp.]|uniref:hypothetical protein n=1 Tax=Pseudoalteromonas sp. TaxID=53249 RepID=UPI0025EF8D70
WHLNSANIISAITRATSVASITLSSPQIKPSTQNTNAPVGVKLVSRASRCCRHKWRPTG